MLLLLASAYAQDCGPDDVFPEWMLPAPDDAGVAVDQAVVVGFRGTGGDLADWDVHLEVEGVEVESAVAGACWYEQEDEPFACIFVVDPVAELPAESTVWAVASEAGVEQWAERFQTGTEVAPTPGIAATLSASNPGSSSDCYGDLATRDISVDVGDAEYVILRTGVDVYGTAVGVFPAGGSKTVLLPQGYADCLAADPVAANGVHLSPVTWCPETALRTFGNEGCDTGILCLISNCCASSNAATLALVIGAFGGWGRLRRSSRHAAR